MKNQKNAAYGAGTEDTRPFPQPFSPFLQRENRKNNTVAAPIGIVPMASQFPASSQSGIGSIASGKSTIGTRKKKIPNKTTVITAPIAYIPPTTALPVFPIFVPFL